MDNETLLRLYRSMVLARQVDERLKVEYANRNIRMPIHLSIGQEAIAAGVLLAGRATDCCLSTHRCHAHYLAKGGDLQSMIDEFYSLGTGCCRGYGGSMHLFDKNVNMWGSSAIVGGTIPIAVGMSLALKQQGSSDVCIAFTGDGGTDEGAFYESLNLAALFGLPLLFVVENNSYATITPQKMRQANPDLVSKARCFGVESECVDGNDVLEVFARSSSIFERIRRDRRPYLLEASTYRLCSHVGPGSDFGPGKRPESEFAQWQDSEPIGWIFRRIRERHPELLPSCQMIEEEVAVQIEAAFSGAKERFDAENARCKLAAPSPPDPNKV